MDYSTDYTTHAEAIAALFEATFTASEADLPAPQPLNQPQGWIAQSLTDAPLTPLNGPARCVPAFDDPALW